MTAPRSRGTTPRNLTFRASTCAQAVTQTILAVARKFPIIRFDAAMTLAREHIHRLWFPETDRKDAIPSRFGHGMTRLEFDAAVPNEFWREVVDRVAVDAPDTLLLAEAFWMMEGYFVRTLGMHRVYNSAFMHMLRDEETGKYRQLIKNTLEFDPQILKRHVNFMSNPDEETAIDQFGTGEQVLWRLHCAGHAAGPAHVCARADGRTARALRHGVSPAEDGRESGSSRRESA